MEQIVSKILADPKPFAIAFLYFAFALSIILICFGICFKMMGNPVTYLINKIFTLLPFVLKEFKGKAGKAGIVNLIIVSAILILAFVALLSPSILIFFTSESNNKSSSLLILIIAAALFLSSLVIVANAEKTTRLLKKD